MSTPFSLVVVLPFLTFWWVAASGGVDKCPPLVASPSCHCFDFENGVFLECPAATADSLRMALQGMQGKVQSLSVFEPDKSLNKLTRNFFPDTVAIRHLQISQSNIEELQDDTLLPLKPFLESFSLVSARLKEIPQRAFKGLHKLIALDLEGNEITELPSYTFYGLRLMKLNLKGNQIQKVSEYSFAGLESTLSELDVSENKLSQFPIKAFRRLEQLRHLRLAWNEINTIDDDSYSHLNSLLYLDLSFNSFTKINEDAFKVCSAVRTLSLYYNLVETVHTKAFQSLKDLETLDLSHNKIVYVNTLTFRANRKIRSIDLSHNHIHYISGVFAFLPELKEVFLSENNILEIPVDAFTDSSNLLVVYLQQNAIRHVDSEALGTLKNLSQLHLSSNFISHLPRNIFFRNTNLDSLSLDDNVIVDLEPGTFDKTVNLREIRLHKNKLQAVHRGVFDPLPVLLELHLQNNEIATIDSGAFRTLQSLQHINLQGNVISELGDVFEHKSPSLVSIHLDSNVIMSLHNESFKGQSSLQIMWLGHNQLKKLEGMLFRDLVLIQRLYLNNNTISVIKDKTFEHMQALKFLDLNHNRLVKVTKGTFAELHELEELRLSHNFIEKIEKRALTNLKRLRILDLSFNPLRVLQDSMFQERLPIRTLTLVNCSVSMIEQGAFRGLNNLNELNLASNNLSAGNLKHLDIPGLRKLQLANNNLSDLYNSTLNGLLSLQVISLRNCNISKLPLALFSKTKNLITIDLSENILIELHPSIFFQLTVLKELRLTANHFKTLPHTAFSNISTLESISMAKNQLSSIDLSQLNGLANLRELDLKENLITTMSGFARTNLTKLQSVDLSRNLLSALPANFFRQSLLLRRIDLSLNHLRHIPNAALSGNTLPVLGWLNLTGNPLVSVHDVTATVGSYPSLEELHMRFTNINIITSNDFDRFSSLLHLILSNNKIMRISPGAFRTLTQLLTLDLGSNDMEILPQERLQGLEQLKLLNVTRNRLKELDDFPPSLKALQILDVSFNQLVTIGLTTFQHLDNLAELYLQGNWISSVSSDAFKSLKKLRILDLRHNYLVQIPLSAFKPLETQIRSLKTEENPLSCTCESQELWEWLRDHQKLVDHQNMPNLKCEEPSELRGKVFMDLDPEQFCDQPIVVKLGIQDIQPFSVVVSWQSRNHSGLHGYQVAYRSLDSFDGDKIRGRMLDRRSRSLKLSGLYPGTKYNICVIALGNWVSARRRATAESWFAARNKQINENKTSAPLDGLETFGDVVLPFLMDSSTSKCSEVITLGSPDLTVLSDQSTNIQSILTRRLGLIIGCVLGFVVFIILVTVLGYLKVKKQRSANKRDQQIPPPPAEYMSYRHFSIQSGGGDRSDHPHFISSQTNTTHFP